jgi:NitT/TauT family transport system permease protein
MQNPFSADGKNVRQKSSWGYFILSIFVWIGVWYFIIWVGNIKPFILPTPLQVAERWIKTIQDGVLLRHIQYTFSEVVLGLLLGSFIAILLGYPLAKSKRLERVLYPFLVASQSVPIVAIAPLLIIWFGPGILSKILISSLIVFFPMLTNTIVGVRSVPQDLLALMKSLRATKWQNFMLLEIPYSLPILFGGLKISATLSVIGAVVGEFVGADRGLGFLINLGRGQYDIALVFVAIINLVLMALIFYGAILMVESRLLKWQALLPRELVRE